MIKLIRPETFTADDKGSTVEMTINGETRRVPASLSPGRYIIAYGAAVKYLTGTKVWHGHVTHWLTNGNEQIGGGFDNVRTRSKVRSILGFYNDFPESRRSQR